MLGKNINLNDFQLKYSIQQFYYRKNIFLKLRTVSWKTKLIFSRASGILDRKLSINNKRETYSLKSQIIDTQKSEKQLFTDQARTYMQAKIHLNTNGYKQFMNLWSIIYVLLRADFFCFRHLEKQDCRSNQHTRP